MEAIVLAATKRAVTGKQVSQLRAQGLIPAVIYGGGVENTNLAVEAGPLAKLLRTVGESSLVDLSIDGSAPVKVLVHDVQNDPLYGRTTHVDFRAVNMAEKLEAEIELVFVGEAPAVKAHGGILQQALDTVTAYCLPGNLVGSIEVDISGLAEFGDTVRVKDLVVPEGVEFRNEPEETIAVINEPISEEDLAKLDEAVTMDVSAVKTAAEEKKAAEEAKAAAEGKAE